MNGLYTPFTVSDSSKVVILKWTMQTRLNLAPSSVVYNMGDHQTACKSCETPARSFKSNLSVPYIDKNVRVNRVLKDFLNERGL